MCHIHFSPGFSRTVTSAYEDRCNEEGAQGKEKAGALEPDCQSSFKPWLGPCQPLAGFFTFLSLSFFHQEVVYNNTYLTGLEKTYGV